MDPFCHARPSPVTFGGVFEPSAQCCAAAAYSRGLIVDLAREQGGCVSRPQLRKAGLSCWKLKAEVRRKFLVPRLRAFGVPSGVPCDAAEASGPYHEALLDASALALSVGPRAIVSGPTAALLQGCEGRWRDAEWPRRLAANALIAYAPPERSMRLDGVKVLRARFTGSWREIHGVVVADRVTALLDTLNLLHQRNLNQARALLDLCLQQRWLTLHELECRLARREAQNRSGGTSRRLTRLLRWAFGEAKAGSHSEAERRLAALLKRHQLLPGGSDGWIGNLSVEMQPEGAAEREGGATPTSRAYSIDIAWPTLRVGIEVDGRAFHSDADSFVRDRHRISDLAAAGWTILPVTWEAVTLHPRELIAQVRAALGCARRRAQM